MRPGWVPPLPRGGGPDGPIPRRSRQPSWTQGAGRMTRNRPASPTRRTGRLERCRRRSRRVLRPHQGMLDTTRVLAPAGPASVGRSLRRRQLVDHGADGHGQLRDVHGERARATLRQPRSASSAPRANSLAVLLLSAHNAAICSASTSGSRTHAGLVTADPSDRRYVSKAYGCTHPTRAATTPDLPQCVLTADGTGKDPADPTTPRLQARRTVLPHRRRRRARCTAAG